MSGFGSRIHVDQTEKQLAYQYSKWILEHTSF